MASTVDIAKSARAALKRAFPRSKISVISSGSVNSIDVTWTDDGPSLQQVQDVLVAAGCAEAHTAWNGERHLRAVDDPCSFWFDRCSPACRSTSSPRS